MSAGCISSSSSTLGCVDTRAPVRVTYVNLHRWPESDAEFVKSVSSGVRGEQHRQRPHHPQARVVDSYSCRQMYLRSYTFSKKETVPERARKCLGKVKEKVAVAVNIGTRVPGCVPWGGGGAVAGDCESNIVDTPGDRRCRKRKKRCLVMRRLREVSSAALLSVFRRLLSCTAAVDVADHHRPF